MPQRLLEKGGVEWLERNVIYGVTVARGQTHPGQPTRYKAFWPESGLSLSLCTSQCVRGVFVCSLHVMDILHMVYIQFLCCISAKSSPERT